MYKGFSICDGMYNKMHEIPRIYVNKTLSDINRRHVTN